MEEDELPLFIPVAVLWEEFVCPICFESVTDCFTTPCGHNFCSQCIRECLNRKHQCPSCNGNATEQQLTKNLHFDNVLQILSREKEKASREYFKSLVRESDRHLGVRGSRPEAEAAAATLDVSVSELMAPVKEVFQRNLVRSLASFEKWFGELEARCEARKTRIRESTTSRMLKIRSEFETQLRHGTENRETLHTQMEASLTQAQKDCDGACDQLMEQLEKSRQLVVENYDRYLAQAAPPPILLPLTVRVVLPSKKIQLELHPKATDTAADVKDLLKEKLRELGDPLVEYSSNNILVFKRLFSSSSVNEKETESGEEIILQDEGVPLGTFGVETGCTLELKGDVCLTSDRPKQCFTATFVKGSGQREDYWTCMTCKFNWICTACAENCHRGHQLKPWITNHAPSWECCYCVKNRVCKITNYTNKAGPSTTL